MVFLFLGAKPFLLELGAAIVGLTLSAAGFAQVMERPIPGDPVRTESGSVAGKLLPSGVKAYFGLPYAAPPVRELRWREAQPVQPWSGVYYALAFKPEEIQLLRAHKTNHYFLEEATSEDCLYANLWAPGDSQAGAKLPVIMWIHGGGFLHGSPSMPNYSGEFLAKKGVIFVGIVYPSGCLGLHGPPRTDGGVFPPRLRQLWLPRPSRGAAMDPPQHCRLRRRSRQCHHHGAICRGRFGLPPSGQPAGARFVQTYHRDERRRHAAQGSARDNPGGRERRWESNFRTRSESALSSRAIRP